MLMKQLILVLAAFSLVGCTSMRTVDLSQGDLAGAIEAGDHLVVYEKQGRIVDMKVTRVENSVLYGSLTEDGFETVQIRLADVEKVEIEKISGAKTTGAVVGGIVLLPVFILGAGMAVAAEGM